jgi:hypothetical protein
MGLETLNKVFLGHDADGDVFEKGYCFRVV